MKKIIFKFMRLFVNCTFPFIMTILSFLLLMRFVYEDYMYGFQFRPIILLLEATPFVGYLIITIITNKFILKPYVKEMSNIVSVLFIFISFSALFWASADSLATNGEYSLKNIKYYKNYYKKYEYIQNVFPKTLPNNIEHVEFHYSPSLLQAGEEYSLYYIDNTLSLSQLDNLYRKGAEWVGKINEYDLKRGLLTNAIFYYSPIDKSKNENDFIIYLMDSNCDNSGYCNHGKYLLVAFNSNTNEVLYRSSDW